MIKSIFEIETYSSINGFIYYLGLLPFVGSFLARISININRRVKFMIGILVYILKHILFILIKVLVAFCLTVVPFSYLVSENIIPISSMPNYYAQVFFFMFCILGSFQESKIFTSNIRIYSLVKYFNAPIRNLVLSNLRISYIVQFASMFIVCLICQIFFGLSIQLWTGIYLTYLALHLFSEAVYLYYFKKIKIVLSKKLMFGMCILCLSCVGSLYPLLLNSKFFVVEILANPILHAVSLIILVGSIVYIKKYDSYDGIENIYINPNETLSEAIKQSNSNALNETKAVNFDVSTTIPHREKGLVLLEYLFRSRYKKVLIKPLLIRISMILVVTTIAIVYYFLNASGITNLIGNLQNIVAIFPIILFMFAYGEKYCRISYNHCDSKLLGYSFFNSKANIYKLLFTRLKYVAIKNIQISFVFCICYITLLLLMGFNPFEIERILLMVVITTMLVVYGTHHLSLYISIQPYSTNNVSINPTIAIVQGVIFFVAFSFMNIDIEPIFMMILLICVYAIYFATLIIIALVRSPSKFVVH